MAVQPAQWLRLGMCHWTTAVAPLFLTPQDMTDRGSAAEVRNDSSGTVQTAHRLCASFWNNAHTIRFPWQEMCQNGSTDNGGEGGGGYEDGEV